MIKMMTANDLEKEASKYDLNSLILLQGKRKENVDIFDLAIKNERNVMQQEEVAQAALETKLRNHDLGLIKLTDTEKEWIMSDLPKIKSTKENRNKTIDLLKTAIMEEYEKMDRESRMIMFLKSKSK